jgi:hypothetical protein
MRKVEDNGFIGPFTSRNFQEDTRAYDGRKIELLQEAGNFHERSFHFLNLQPANLGTPVNWCFAPESDRLWQYNLHYGEWAITLARAYSTSKETRFKDSLIDLLNDWIDHNPVGKGPGWEPYPISRRLVAWSRVGPALREDPLWQDFVKARLVPSLRQQTKFLASNLEHDLANNHLVANYKALAWIGFLFPSWPETQKWKSIGLTGLWSEMRRQVLSDGVHDERSISYHTIVLQDLLEIWWLAKQVGEVVPEDVEPTLTRMFQFLADTQAPDGTWPMVNDSIPGYPTDPRSVLLAGGVLFQNREFLLRGEGGAPGYALWLTGEVPSVGNDVGLNDSRPNDARPNDTKTKVFEEAGYAVLQDKNQSYLLFDAGPMGPGHIQGHGHADALSFVLYGTGRPLIVDPGVFSYHNKFWRDHFRNTVAHNTVAVDNQDQCVFWGPFRVAYPPKVRLLESSDNHVFGEHEGYTRFSKPVIHRRRIERRTTSEWEILDQFEGRGEHEFALNLQFAPGANAQISGVNGEARWPDGTSLQVICVTPPTRALGLIEQGWVSPEWNLKEEAPKYVLHWRSEVPTENRIILKIKTT